MIPLLGTTTITRTRFGAQTNVDGILTPGAGTSTSITATVIEVEDRQKLPEHLHAKRVAEVVTYSEVRDARAGLVADRLVIGADTWEVVKVEHLPAFMGQPQHWEAYAVFVESSQVGAA